MFIECHLDYEIEDARIMYLAMFVSCAAINSRLENFYTELMPKDECN